MAPLSETLSQIARKPGRWTVAGLPEGADSLVLAELARTTGGQDILHVARDGQRLERLQDGLRFFAPEREVLVFPAWDCLPYDRLSPHPDIVAERLETLARLAAPRKAGAPARIILASVGAALQKVPPRSLYAEAAIVLRKGQTLDVAWLTKFLSENGYGRSETVMEPGEFAVRGGLVDLFPPGTSEPLRLDLFGDTLEAIRSFDAMSQRSTGARDEVVLLPVSEVLLTPESIARFRSGYRELFGNVAGDDILYEAVSAGQRHVGMEHWLPLFHDHLETLLDYCPEAIVTADHQIAEAFQARHELITDYYDARLQDRRQGRHERRRRLQAGAARAPLPQAVGMGAAARRPQRRRSSPASTRAPDAPNTIDLGGRRHEGFAQARTAQGVNLFDKVAEHVQGRQRRRPPRRDRGLHRRLGGPPAASAAGARRHDAGSGARLCDRPRPAAGRGRRRGVVARARLRARRPRSHRRGGHSRRPPVAAGQEAPPVGALHRRGGGAQRGRPGRPSRARRRPLRGPGDAGDPARAPRLPAAHLRGRRQALRAGREHRRAEPLRRGRGGRPARSAGRRRLAVAQGPAEAAHRRHGRPADQDRRRARHPPRRDDEPARRPLRGVLRPLPLCRDRRPAAGDLRRAGRHVVGQADGPADLRRCRLRQDRGGAARGLRRRPVGQAGGGDRPDDPAGAPASPHLRRALPGPAGAHRPAVAAGRRQGGQGHQGGDEGGHGRHRDRHPRAAGQERRVQGSRPADRRRGAAFRRRPQGAAEGAARRRPCADAHRHADPAHPAARPDRRARHEPDRHAAGRSPGGAHLRHAVRRRHHPRGPAARAVSRRPDLLCLPAHRGPGAGRGRAARAGARDPHGHGARPAVADRHREHHAGFRRRQVRRAAVDQHRRDRASTSATPTPW